MSIRKLDDDTYDRLRVRAVRHGVSMEEEVRQILKRAVAPPERLSDLFLKTFGPARGVELDLPPRVALQQAYEILAEDAETAEVEGLMAVQAEILLGE